MLSRLEHGTHMPFAVSDSVFLFCTKLAQTSQWRAMKFDGSLVEPLDVRNDGCTQCSPVGEFVGAEFHWSYINTCPCTFTLATSDGMRSCHEGPSFTLPSSHCTVSRIMDRNGSSLMPRTFVAYAGTAWETTLNRLVLRVVPAGAGAVLMTLRSFDGRELRTCLLSQSGQTWDILLPDGSAPYKASFFEDGLWYAKDRSNALDDREIAWSPEYVKVPVSTDVFLKAADSSVQIENPLP